MGLSNEQTAMMHDVSCGVHQMPSRIRRCLAPFGVLAVYALVSGGIASLNPRLMAGTPIGVRLIERRLERLSEAVLQEANSCGLLRATELPPFLLTRFAVRVILPRDDQGEGVPCREG